MSNLQSQQNVTSQVAQSFTTPLSPVNIVTNYEFCILTAVTEVFESEVFYFNALHELNLMGGLGDTIPTDFHSTYTNTIVEDETTALETQFSEESTTLVSFFALQMIDIPKPFSRSKSLYSISAAVPKLRLINMLMRHGQRAKVSIAFSKSMHNLSSLYIASRIGTGSSVVFDWRLFYTIFNQMLPVELTYSKNGKLVFEDQLNTAFTNKYSQNIEEEGYFIEPIDWLQKTIFDELEKHIPLFSFYVKKVDKLKRKHSRGKSGKYSIIWKYVPRYKRMLTTLRWLTKDVRFQKSKTFSLRLNRSFEVFMFDKASHLVPQLRQFVHKFVFKHHKKTLLKTLRSTA